MNLQKYWDLTMRVSLVRNLIHDVRHSNQACPIDITYVPVKHGYLYWTNI